MNRMERAAVLADLADRLTAAGSWCGETHLQKAVYLLQALARAPLGFEFVLYKHGPFSFDLRDELTGLRADGLFQLRSRPPYGPSLAPTPAAQALKVRLKSAVESAEPGVRFIATAVGPKPVAELERLATAVYVTREGKAHGSNRALRLSALKPHVRAEDAASAVGAADELTARASRELVPVSR